MTATIAATGYATVDVLSNGDYRVVPGGTATNVARALASRGWISEFVGTIGRDPAGDFLSSNLRDSGVGVTQLFQDERWTTPVILQRMRGLDHSWQFRCPECGAPFAKHRPTGFTRASEILERLNAPDVFFFDRTSLFAIALAEAWKAAGSFVVFEPAGLGRPQLFDRAAATADMIKFSGERAAAFRDRIPQTNVLIVETLGAGGARFRLPKRNSWHTVPADPVPFPVDYVGAGDWTTAGILDSLGPRDSRSVNLGSVHRAVREGQRLGALACTWEGVHPGAFQPLPGGIFEKFACARYLAADSAERQQGRVLEDQSD